LKRDVRFLGFDDSPFTFEDEQVRVVGVVTRGASYVERILSQHLRIDGDDATRVLCDLVQGSRFRPMLRGIFLNGATMGGFNVVDLDEIHREVGVPVVAVVRHEPDYAKSERALRKHLPDAQRRIELLGRQRPDPVKNGTFTVWCTARGVDHDDLSRLLEASTVRGALPEPIRLAHVIASGIARGHSRGPA
jgi:uncharacterized protein